MTDLERLEHVADGWRWDKDSEPGLTGLVRAILTELREPSEGMVAAISAVLESELSEYDPHTDQVPQHILEAAIDHILKETK